MKNGKVLLSMKSSKLNIWDFEGKLGLFQSFKSFDTYGICVGKEIEILNGLSSSNVVNELDTSGKILVLNAEKQVVNTYEHDKKTKQKLFKCPLKIVINYEKSICVIDVDNNMKDDGRVLCLNPEGTLNWKCEGSNSPNFKPYDLATNSEGSVCSRYIRNDTLCKSGRNRNYIYSALYRRYISPAFLWHFSN